MEINIPSGKYVLAVSGGVDSMVLLDLLSKLSGVELVVAHFNHGIRDDSGEDERLAAATARDSGLPFEAGYGNLGANASEEAARSARYGFLDKVKAEHKAGAIITAHHQDDVIETALINLLRGTGRRGLTAISDNKDILRPLLRYPKSQIIDYAQKNNLEWREDSTNADTGYLRNYIRRNLVPAMTAAQRAEFLRDLRRASDTGLLIEGELSRLSSRVRKGELIDRSKFSSLPAELGSELLIFWLREEGLRDFDKPAINRLNVALRTAKGGSTHLVKKGLAMRISARTARFERQRQR